MIFKLNKYFSILLLICAPLILSGCATALSYKLDPKNTPPSNITHPLKVAVTTFEDARPECEHSLEIRKDEDQKEYNCFTEDKIFGKRPVSVSLSSMLAKHLSYAKIFKETQFVDIPSQEISTNGIPEDLKLNYDAVLVGKIQHFFGYHKPNVAVRSACSPLMLFGAIGGGIYGGIVGSLKEPVEGHAQFSNIELIRTKDNTVAWEGEVDYYFKESKSGMTSQIVALSSLKEASNKLVSKLSNIEQWDSKQLVSGLSVEEERASNKGSLGEKIETTSQSIKENKRFEKSKIISYREYYRYLYNSIAKTAKLPKESQSGTINASFTLLSDGSLESVTILEGSSEDTALREAVEKAIMDCVPFPPFPEDMKGKDKETFTLSLDFKFNN